MERAHIRIEQAAVFFTLRRHQGQSLSVRAIAEELNRGLRTGATSPITELDVEATLAALLLRPELRRSVLVFGRPVRRQERRRRAGLGYPILATSVLLAACAVPQVPVLIPPPTPPLANYYGGVGSIPRPMRAAAVYGYDQAGLSPPSPISVAGVLDASPQPSQKTIGSSISAGAASSFFGANFEEFVVVDNPEPNLEDTSAATASARVTQPLAIDNGRATPYGAHEVAGEASARASNHPVNGELSDVDDRGAQALASQLQWTRREAAMWPGADTPPRLEHPPPIVEDEPSDFLASRAEISAMVAALPGASSEPAVQSDVRFAHHHESPIRSWYEPDHFVVSFRNGSQQINDEARQMADAIVAEIGVAQSIDLRGRVGRNFLDEKDRLLAVGRAIAVRKELVDRGVDRARIRILTPRAGDLLDSSAFDSPLNMSVSVMLRPAASLAHKLSKHPRA